MSEAYYIRDWKERYEVTSDDREAKPDQYGRKKLRAGPLRYIRYPVAGHTVPIQDQRMKTTAESPSDFEAALCLWPKLLGLAGAQNKDYRGWVLTERQEPAVVDDLVLFTGIRPQTIARALELLAHADVGLIELRPFPPNSAEDCEILQDSAKALINDTENRTDTETETETKTDTDTDMKTGTTPSDSVISSRSLDESDRASKTEQNSDSGSGHLTVQGFAQILAVKLGLSPTDPEQVKRDLRCFMRVAADHIIPGHLGEPVEAAERCYAKAEQIANDPAVYQKDRAKVLVAWLKKELSKKGHQWGDRG